MPESLFSWFIGGVISVGLGILLREVLGLFGTVVAIRHLSAETFGAFVLLEMVAGVILLVLLSLTLSQRNLIISRLTADDVGSTLARITLADGDIDGSVKMVATSAQRERIGCPEWAS